MLTAQKQCVPDALAGAPGTSPMGEGADRPTPHDRTVATPCDNRKRFGCVLVWRDGTLAIAPADTKLTVLQHALLHRPAPPG